MTSLPLFHRVAGHRVVVLGDGDAADAKRRLVRRAGGEPCAETEAHHTKLAFVALDDPRAAEAAAIRLRCKGLLVNVADRPELCDFTLPSVLDRDPVLVAIGTGGASAGLAKHLRLRLEALLPHSLGDLARALFAGRERLRERFPAAEDRRHALDVALGEGGPLDSLAEDSADQVAVWLGGDADTPAPETVDMAIASTDPEDLTIRQARLLGRADAVLHDPAIAAAILDRARADAVRLPLPAKPPADARLSVVLRRA